MNEVEAQAIADKVIAQANGIKEALAEMYTRMLALNKEIAGYDKYLCALDHELEITVLTAPQLSRVLSHRKRVLNDRRAAKHEYLLYRRVDNHFNFERSLAQVTNGVAHAKKAPTEVVRSQGLIDEILSKGGESNVGKSNQAAS